VAAWKKCRELNRPVTFGVQKRLRLLWTRREQYNRKPLGSNRNKYKVGVIKGEIIIMTPTTHRVVREGDANRIAGRTVRTIMRGTAPPGQEAGCRGQMLREDMKGNYRRRGNNKKRELW
jgi:hypothetical protein